MLYSYRVYNLAFKVFHMLILQILQQNHVCDRKQILYKPKLYLLTSGKKKLFYLQFERHRVISIKMDWELKSDIWVICW